MKYRIPVSSSMIEVIKDLQSKTGVSLYAVFKWAELETPKPHSGVMNLEVAYSLLSGRTKTIHIDDYLYLKELYEKIPEDQWRKQSDKITPELREKLKAEIERTGIGNDRFIHCAKNIPEGMTKNRLYNILRSSSLKYFKNGEREYIFEQYASFPTQNMPITPKMRKKLKSELKRTGICSSAMLASEPNRPHKFNVGAIQLILKGNIPDTMNEGHWDWLLSTLSNMPDQRSAEPSAKPKRPLRTTGPIFGTIKTPRRLLSLSQEMILELNEELDRTGISLSAITKRVAGLRLDRLSRWKRGEAKSVSPENYKSVMSLLAGLPDKAASKEKQTYYSKGGSPFPEKHKVRGQSPPARTSISDEYVRHIIEERARTGIGATQLLRREDVPKGLSANMISSWINNNALTAQLHLLDWVKKTYSNLPDK